MAPILSTRSFLDRVVDLCLDLASALASLHVPDIVQPCWCAEDLINADGLKDTLGRAVHCELENSRREEFCQFLCLKWVMEIRTFLVGR